MGRYRRMRQTALVLPLSTLPSKMWIVRSVTDVYYATRTQTLFQLCTTLFSELCLVHAHVPVCADVGGVMDALTQLNNHGA